MPARRMTLLTAIVAVVLVLAVMAVERSGILAEGTAAPPFTGRTEAGETIRLTDYAGKSVVVLYFYPADFTPGCTEQACAFRDAYQDLRDAGAVVLGISADPDASHRKFSATYRLPFPLINDSERVIARAYGVLRLGGLVPMPKRVTYVIDRKGVIRLAAHHEIRMRQNVEEVREILRTIQEE